MRLCVLCRTRLYRLLRACISYLFKLGSCKLTLCNALAAAHIFTAHGAGGGVCQAHGAQAQAAPDRHLHRRAEAHARASVSIWDI